MERCIENAENHCKSYPRCYGCGAFRTPTNADRIRSMNDEELAEFLCGVHDEDDEWAKFIDGYYLPYDQYSIKEWLKQPAEEGKDVI